MKKYLHHTLSVLMLALLVSCGEDRSGEFYALIEDRMWIEQTMQENYLWYEEMPTIENEYDYFKQPEVFFKNLLYKKALDGKGDNYSYLEKEATTTDETRAMTLERTSTYGMEFQLTTDPTGTTNHTFARILYVLEGSPAEAAGIRRGDWIATVNGERINNENYRLLQNGGNLELTRNTLTMEEEGWNWQETETIQVGPSVQMEINPFLVNRQYEVNGQRIAYLM
jgi:C-terminal processing protease CtpA/Prc